jgi:oligosaccharide reducing-end xylanase
MQHRTEPRKTYFAWHCTTSEEVIDSTAASDGEEWTATALLFASARWGNGEGVFNYSAEAQAILDAMLNKEGKPWSIGKITNMFNTKEKQVVFVPVVEAAGFTDPSYYLPHFTNSGLDGRTRTTCFGAKQYPPAGHSSRKLLIQ